MPPSIEQYIAACSCYMLLLLLEIFIVEVSDSGAFECLLVLAHTGFEQVSRVNYLECKKTQSVSLAPSLGPPDTKVNGTEKTFILKEFFFTSLFLAHSTLLFHYFVATGY